MPPGGVAPEAFVAFAMARAYCHSHDGLGSCVDRSGR